MPTNAPAAARPTTGGRVLRRAVRRHRTRLIGSSALFCLHQFCETMVPVAIGIIVARAVETGDVTAMLLSLVGLAALFVVLSFAYRIGARIIVVAIEREAHLLRVEVASTVLDPRGLDTDLSAGELLTVGTSDAEKTSWILDVLARSASAGTALVVTAVALLVVDVPLGLAVVIGTPLLLLVLQWCAPVLTRAATASQTEIARVSGLATDLVGGVRPLRGIGGEETAARRYADASRRALAATLRLARGNSAYLGLSATVGSLLAAAVAGGAGYLALTGRLTLGELVTVVGLAQFLVEPLSSLSRLPGVTAVVRGSADRIAIVLGARPLVATSSATRPAATAATGAGSAPHLALHAVAHGSLRGVDLDAASGESVGVVAYRPSDAESLVAVLSGQIPHDASTGRVTVDGTDVRDLPLADVRRTLLVEPHAADLFAGTVRSNIAVRSDPAVTTNPAGGSNPRTGATDEHRLHSAVAASAVTDLIDLHEDGLDHPVTDRGASLSGGQRQRVALARALAADPPVLVLHDPTTAVDAVTEHAIADGIRTLRDGPERTTVIVTTSPALLAVTDRVVVVDEGRVVTTGTHRTLAATDETYRERVLR
ncbi:ABC transporter transmembrane domain-containing protein [Rhodococcoides corynebacterioides]|uniref:ABC transporter ATP-binding protein n=1 Tax=Rhodococcoides corynebacterioides TaxID=53972 RepID=A0ABS7P8I6_9NOCA|nr:ABC transporter ATP-binding protein [Rhodococcus corynebacterioides]MBY6368167.1 ABC transporter ATP-binding protein [Rhodococcus corynebacterioides]MBY6409022.1 ABC transporter ATP-binding protein [Rhodococcus corynebacterioides]